MERTLIEEETELVGSLVVVIHSGGEQTALYDGILSAVVRCLSMLSIKEFKRKNGREGRFEVVLPALAFLRSQQLDAQRRVEGPQQAGQRTDSTTIHRATHCNVAAEHRVDVRVSSTPLCWLVNLFWECC
jgi:hypothetical protein